jgi:hypothetical protein
VRNSIVPSMEKLPQIHEEQTRRSDSYQEGGV